MKIFQIIKGIVNHPLNRTSPVKALVRFFRWQLFSRIAGYPIIWPWIGSAKLVMERGLAGATGNLYNGLHEFSDMSFLLHFVREDDSVVDVGANVGVYTILASVVGGARVISFEPVPQTYQHLLRNVIVNQVSERVQLVQAACGAQSGILRMSLSAGAANHVKFEDPAEGIEVTVVTLDDLLSEPPSILKIDVEGFEIEVIRGSKTILSAPELKAIIIELNGLGNRYGFNDEMVHNELVSFGFTPYRYEPFTRTLTAETKWGTHNTLYIRDIVFVQNRVTNGLSFNINSQQI